MATSTYVGSSLPPRASLSGFYQRLRGGDEVAYITTLTAAGAILVVVALIVIELALNSRPTIHAFGWSFLTSRTWDPNGEHFGALPFIYGTCVTSLLALIIAVPLGVASAVFLAEMAPPQLSNLLTFLIELLAAVPSVIYGLIGIFVLLPLIRDYVVPVLQKTLGFLPIFSGDFYGVSFLSAGLVLSVMVVPFIVSVSREVLLAVPVEQR
jgi:phosphate transport system permease protein